MQSVLVGQRVGNTHPTRCVDHSLPVPRYAENPSVFTPRPLIGRLAAAHAGCSLRSSLQNAHLSAREPDAHLPSCRAACRPTTAVAGPVDVGPPRTLRLAVDERHQGRANQVHRGDRRRDQRHRQGRDGEQHRRVHEDAGRARDRRQDRPVPERRRRHDVATRARRVLRARRRRRDGPRPGQLRALPGRHSGERQQPDDGQDLQARDRARARG